MASGRRPRVVMLLENNPYPHDVRVRREAQALAQADYAVTVIAPGAPGQASWETVDGVRVNRFSLPATGDSMAGIVIEYLIANLQLYARGAMALIGGADIVHMHNPPDTLFGVAWLARALGRRAIYDLHDIGPELFEVKFGPHRVVGVLRWLERRSARSANAMITVNDSLRALAAARDGLDVEAITVVRNAPPRAMLGEARPGRDGSLSDPRLVFVGSIESQDGVGALPEVVWRLRDDHGLSGVSLTVVGDGSARAAVQAGCAAAGVADCVHFTGRVPYEQISGLLADADVCVEPAPYNELNDRCSMVKVYEYMAAGRPIVGFALAEVRRMAGEDMLYARGDRPSELAEQIAQLAADPELRRTLGQRLAERAGRLTWEQSAQSLVAVYDRLGR